MKKAILIFVVFLDLTVASAGQRGALGTPAEGEGKGIPASSRQVPGVPPASGSGEEPPRTKVTVNGQVVEPVEIEGKLLVFCEDSEHTSRTLYFLDDGRERLSLHFTDAPPTGIQSGSRVRVKGTRVGQSIS